VRGWIAEEIVPSVKVRGARLVPKKVLERVLSPIKKQAIDAYAEARRVHPMKQNNTKYNDVMCVEIYKTLGIYIDVHETSTSIEVS
jgi:hypothetical protein